MSRRRWLLLSAPVLLAVLVVAVKLASLSYFAGRGDDAYRAGRYAVAADEYAHLGVVNVVQSWVSPFNRGDALYSAKSYPAARAEFAHALPLAPAARVCTVRHNLTLAGERVGDEAVYAKDVPAAIAAYTRALRDAGDCASTVDQRARLRTLLDELHALKPTQSSRPTPGKSSSPTDNQQQLQQRNQQAEQQQQSNQQDNLDANNGNARNNPSGKNW